MWYRMPISVISANLQTMILSHGHGICGLCLELAEFRHGCKLRMDEADLITSRQ